MARAIEPVTPEQLTVVPANEVPWADRATLVGLVGGGLVGTGVSSRGVW